MTDPAPRDSRVPDSRFPVSTKLNAWNRWLSLQAYGLFTSTLFRARAAIAARRFERFACVSRGAMLRKHPKLVFEDHCLGPVWVESVRAIDQPSCVIIHLHGGAFVFGSPNSYRNRAMRLSYRCKAEVFMPDYRLAPEHRGFCFSIQCLPPSITRKRRRRSSVVVTCVSGVCETTLSSNSPIDRARSMSRDTITGPVLVVSLTLRKLQTRRLTKSSSFARRRDLRSISI